MRCCRVTDASRAGSNLYAAAVRMGSTFVGVTMHERTTIVAVDGLSRQFIVCVADSHCNNERAASVSFRAVVQTFETRVFPSFTLIRSYN